MDDFSAENIIKALDIFYSPSVAPADVQKLNAWLSSAQSSRDAWTFSIALLQVHLPVSAQYFGANALHHKLSSNFDQLSFEQHDEFRNCLARLIRTYGSHADNGNARRILHRLCACFAMLLVQSIPDFWDNAFADTERLLHDENNAAISITLFLQVAKCVPEQFSSAHVALERRNEVRGELARSVLFIINRCVQVLRSVSERDEKLLSLSTGQRNAVCNAISCATCWCNQFGLTVPHVDESGLFDVALRTFLLLATGNGGEEQTEADADPFELAGELLCGLMSLTDLHRFGSILQRIACQIASTRDLIVALKAARIAAEDKEKLLFQVAKVLSSFVENHTRVILSSFAERAEAATAILEALLDLLAFTHSSETNLLNANANASEFEAEQFELERSRIELCLSAFFYVADEIRADESNQFAANSSLFSFVFERFVDLLLERSRFPRSSDAFRRFVALPSDVRDEFSQFRHESIAGAFQSALIVLGHTVFRKVLAYERSLVQNNINSLQSIWTEIEVVCFAMTNLLACRSSEIRAASDSQYAAYASELYAFLELVCSVESHIVQLTPSEADCEWLVYLSSTLLEFIGRSTPLFSSTVLSTAESDSEPSLGESELRSRSSKLESIISLLIAKLQTDLASRSGEIRTRVFTALRRTVATNGTYLQRHVDYAFELMRHFTSLAVSNFDWLIRNDLQNARSLAECIGHSLNVCVRHVSVSGNLSQTADRESCVQQTVDSLFEQFTHEAYLESAELSVRVVYVLSGLFSALSGTGSDSGADSGSSSGSESDNASVALFATLNLLERVSQSCMRVTERHLAEQVVCTAARANETLHVTLIQNICALLLAATKTVGGSNSSLPNSNSCAIEMPESAAIVVSNVMRILMHFMGLCVGGKLSVPEIYTVALECVATFQNASCCKLPITQFVKQLCGPVAAVDVAVATLSPEMLEALLQFAVALLKSANSRSTLEVDDGQHLVNLVRLATQCLTVSEVQTVKAACKFMCEAVSWSEQSAPLFAALTGNSELLHTTLLTAVCGTTPRSFTEFFADVFVALNTNAQFMQALRIWLERNLIAADERQSAICALVSKSHRITFVRQVLRERSKRRMKQLLVEFSLRCRGLADTDYAKMTLNT